MSEARQDFPNINQGSGVWTMPSVPMPHLVITALSAASGTLIVSWSAPFRVLPLPAGIQPDTSVSTGQIKSIDTGLQGGRSLYIADSAGGAFSASVSADREPIDAAVVGVVALAPGASVGISGTANTAPQNGPPNVNATGNLNALNAAVAVALTGLAGAGVQLPAASTLVGTLTPEISFDGGATWTAAAFFDPVTGRINFTLTVASGVPTAQTILVTAGATNARARVSAYTSGTAAATVTATASPPGASSVATVQNQPNPVFPTTDPAIWGNGGAGNLTLVANAALAVGAQYNKIDVAGWTLSTGGYPIQALSMDTTVAGGTVDNSGTAGVAGGAASGVTAGAAGTGGAGGAGASLGAGAAGVAGGIGVNGAQGNGSGTSAAPGVAGNTVFGATFIGGVAKPGGAGGAGGSGAGASLALPGAGGAAPATQSGGVVPVASSVIQPTSTFAGGQSGGGGGGGGGGAGDGATPPKGGGGGGGGGSGGGGGAVLALVQTFVNTHPVTFQSNGGAGGAGGQGGNALTSGGNAGGGGGGGGGSGGGAGLIIVISQSTAGWSTVATVGAAGAQGAAGTGFSGGTGGSVGSNGHTGAGSTPASVSTVTRPVTTGGYRQ